MGVTERIPGLGRLAGYERASVIGSLLIILGSMMSWLEVTASEQAAAQHDDLEAGTNVFTGQYLGWGDITLVLGIVAIVVLALVLWRYHAPGRKTGLLLMLLGLVVAAIGVLGIAVTGLLFSGIEQLEGATLDIGIGIFLTLLGALVLLSGGILRLAAGPPEREESPSAVDAADGGESVSTD